ncbi:hypothetical protein PPL_08711 [Heterostelium album PN500]|uniref:Uncharacterized protein n=1 Tax=Heterostelium pallidum (strain ATCC 26659 / Pp 5 / PN500) TaxID=670386 RepID=D3BJI5_HETP5|nr:hypothetical protein PPL_08711 [Heterostelium album PN500]EFA78065.1 hypothetical protein PPL_08711 [Heterostelium album PN500]|eukprot:XP_020430192.1 hypothetical protein PPL_08711 [Heterostelium album PN500]
MFNNLPYLVRNYIIELSLSPFMLDDDEEYDYRNEIHQEWRQKLGMVSWCFFEIVSKKLNDFTLTMRNKRYAREFATLLNGEFNRFSIIKNLTKLSLYRVFRDSYVSFLSGDELDQKNVVLTHSVVSPLTHLKIVDDVEMTMLSSILLNRKYRNLNTLELEVHGWENDGHEIGILSKAISLNSTIKEYHLVFHEYGGENVLNRERYLPLVKSLSAKSQQLSSVSLMMTIDGIQTISEVFSISTIQKLAITTSASDPNLLSFLSEQLGKSKSLKECRVKLTSTSIPTGQLASEVANAFYINTSF